MWLKPAFHDSYFVIKGHDARNPLAAMDAKLPLVERFYSAPNCHHARISFDLDISETRHMLPIQKIDDSPF